MRIRCSICPKGCELAPGEFGDCRVRTNIDGVINCVTYGYPCAINVDPIEKKPLYHFLPGSSVLSVGMAGCNLHCEHCQNWDISQSNHTPARATTPEEIVEMARERRIPSIAYTYTEPLVSYEFTRDCCKAADSIGLKNTLITAAYINPEPLRALCEHVAAANVDLKSFSNDFYSAVCGARLEPVLTALKVMKEMNVMLEITNLLIPRLNDAEDETRALSDWVVNHLGSETPIHFSRFYPRHQSRNLPPTPLDTIHRAREIAMEAGAKFVYVGNMSDRVGESTWCPDCGAVLIERNGYLIERNTLNHGTCPNCGYLVPGVWA